MNMASSDGLEIQLFTNSWNAVLSLELAVDSWV
jgi:hypothetical protein